MGHRGRGPVLHRVRPELPGALGGGLNPYDHAQDPGALAPLRWSAVEAELLAVIDQWYAEVFPDTAELARRCAALVERL